MLEVRADGRSPTGARASDTYTITTSDTAGTAAPSSSLCEDRHRPRPTAAFGAIVRGEEEQTAGLPTRSRWKSCWMTRTTRDLDTSARQWVRQIRTTGLAVLLDGGGETWSRAGSKAAALHLGRQRQTGKAARLRQCGQPFRRASVNWIRPSPCRPSGERQAAPGTTARRRRRTWSHAFQRRRASRRGLLLRRRRIPGRRGDGGLHHNWNCDATFRFRRSPARVRVRGEARHHRRSRIPTDWPRPRAQDDVAAALDRIRWCTSAPLLQ